MPVIVNLCGASTGELGEAARRFEGVPGVAGIELNLSCGGGARVFGLDALSTSGAVAAVRRATELPLIAKLTAAAGDVRAVARAAEEAGADAISAINTLPGLAVAGDRRGPALGSIYGGICGPALKPVTLRVVYEVAQAVDIPVIGIGGVATLDDVLDLLAVAPWRWAWAWRRWPTRCCRSGSPTSSRTRAVLGGSTTWPRWWAPRSRRGPASPRPAGAEYAR